MKNQYFVRNANIDDKEAIIKLYQRTSSLTGGIIRKSNEVTEAYINDVMNHCFETGIQLLLIDSFNGNEIIGEIHGYKLGPVAFNHVLSNVTIVVKPDFQGKGLGKLLFNELLNWVTEKRTDILRIELFARESNTKAISFYKKIGFKVEGKFEKRILKDNNHFEADVAMAWIKN